MNEIEELYENVGVEKRRECEFDEYCPLGFGHSRESCLCLRHKDTNTKMGTGGRINNEVD